MSIVDARRFEGGEGRRSLGAPQHTCVHVPAGGVQELQGRPSDARGQVRPQEVLPLDRIL